MWQWGLLTLFLLVLTLQLFRLKRQRTRLLQQHTAHQKSKTQEIQVHVQEKETLAREKARALQEKETLAREKARALQEKETLAREKARALQEKETLARENEQTTQQLKALQKKNAKTEAKLLEQKKSQEVKKKNLEKYRSKKRETRRNKQSIEEKIAQMLENNERSTKHSITEPKSNKLGKPPGSKGGGRKRPELIHEVRTFYPTTCKRCGRSLEGETMVFSHDSVVVELFHESDELGCYKSYSLKNIQKNIHRARCPECLIWCSPHLGVFKGARFGPGVISHVISQRIDTALPYEAIIAEMKKMFGSAFALHPSSIVEWFKKFEQEIGHIYEQLEVLLKEELFVHIDETGLSLQGENWWLWVICCANLVLYRVSETRGHVAIKDIIEGFEGTIIADFFSAYEKFAANPHQKCLAHLLSDIIEHIVKLTKQNRKIDKKLAEHEEAVEREKQLQEGRYKKGRGRRKKLEKLTDKQTAHLSRKKVQNEEAIEQAVQLGTFFRQPFVEGAFSYKKPLSERITKEEAELLLSNLLCELRERDPKDETIKRLLKRCEKYKGQLFTYLQHEGMPPDNNQAERSLRKFARQRKISGDFKSGDVLRNYAMYLSFFMTCQANGLEFDEFLRDILLGRPVDLRSLLLSVK